MIEYMLPPTHLAIGYLSSQLYCSALQMECSSQPLFTSVVIVSSLFPDIDIFFGKKVNDHRNTIFHAPIFYISIISVLIIMSLFKNNLLPYTIALALGVFTHLFLDWFSGRTIGIRLFYPFSKKMYSLFPLNSKIGDVSIIPNKKNKDVYILWLRHFFLNSFLATIEIVLLFISLLVFFLQDHHF